MGYLRIRQAVGKEALSQPDQTPLREAPGGFPEAYMGAMPLDARPRCQGGASEGASPVIAG